MSLVYDNIHIVYLESLVVEWLQTNSLRRVEGRCTAQPQDNRNSHDPVAFVPWNGCAPCGDVLVNGWRTPWERNFRRQLCKHTMLCRR